MSSTRVAAVAAILGVAAFVFMRALATRTNYDEGVYLASLEALRHGQRLGDDVYAAQPPAFYALLRAVTTPFGHSLEGIRVGFALIGMLGVGMALATGWKLFGFAAGLATGALVVVAPPYPTVAPTVAADVPSIALGICALACAAFATRPAPSRRWAAAAGAVLALAVLVKLLALPFLVPIICLGVAGRCVRRLGPAFAAGAAAAAALILGAYASALPELWQGVVGDHPRAHGGEIVDNADRLAHFLDLHTPLAWLVAAGAVVTLVVPRARQTWPLWTLIPAAAAFLVLRHPLLDHHLALLSASYALAAGPSLALGIASLRRSRRPLAAGLLAAMLAAGAYQEQRRLHRNDLAEPAEIGWAAGVIARETGPDDLVATDLPIISFLSRRAPPGDLADTSSTRIGSGALSQREILRAIDDAHAPATVVGRMFTSIASLAAELERRYTFQRACGGLVVYLRRAPKRHVPPCPP